MELFNVINPILSVTAILLFFLLRRKIKDVRREIEAHVNFLSVRMDDIYHPQKNKNLRSIVKRGYENTLYLNQLKKDLEVTSEDLRKSFGENVKNQNININKLEDKLKEWENSSEDGHKRVGKKNSPTRRKKKSGKNR